MRRQLRKLGLDPLCVRDGQAALETLEKASVDLVFMDLHLPRLSGFETARRLRDRLGARPVVVGLTGEAGPGVRRRCLEAGMDDCFFKPMSIDQLTRFLVERTWPSLESL